MNNSFSLKKILFTINGLDYGGREVQLVQLAKMLRRRGWDIHMVTMLPPQAFVGELECDEIYISPLNMKRGKADFRAVASMASIIREYSPTVVHSHLIHANLLTRIARLFVDIPILISTIGNIKQGGKLHEILFKLTDPLCDLTTNVSQLSVDRYIADRLAPAHKIKYIPNSIDTKRFAPSESGRQHVRAELNLKDEFVWLAVGRLEPQKDYFTMLRAFLMVVQQFPDSVLLICGQGSLVDSIREFVHQIGLSSSVQFLGVRNDIPNLMNAADAYVMSSAWEGMPGVLLEASATALPVVSTNVSGSCEIVLDNLSGFLTPPGDPDQLARSMLNIMSLSPENRRSMGSVARTHIINNFGLEKGVEVWESLYLDLIQKKVSSRKM